MQSAKTIITLIEFFLKYINEKIILLVLSIIIFLPDIFLNKIGLLDFKMKYSIIISIIFLFFLVYNIFCCINNIINNNYLWVQKIKIKKYLKNLTPVEKEILNKYIQNKTKTIYFSYTDGVVAGLVNERILFHSTNINFTTAYNPKRPFNLYDWIYRYLNKNEELLK